MKQPGLKHYCKYCAERRKHELNNKYKQFKDMIEFGTIVRINWGMFRGCVGTLTGSFKYNDKDVFIILMKRLEGTTGQLKDTVATLLEGQFETATNYKRIGKYMYA